MLYQTINPATGEIVDTFPTISDADLEVALHEATLAYEDWRHRPIATRAAILAAAATLLRDNAEEYASYITLEMGKLHQGAIAEVGLSAAILDYYARNAEAFMAPQRFDGFPGAEVVTRPIGAILAIEPWNFPYYQIARVVGPQLAAGNVLLLKHAESVPQCALAFARLLEQAGAPKGIYTNLFVSHDQVSRLIADRRIAGVTVTGSERAGAAVAEQAGRNLKKVVMELGGSDPLIVLTDAPLEATLDSAVFGRMFNAGQSCVASKRIIVVGKARGDAFIRAYADRIGALRIGDPSDDATDLGPVSSERAMTGLLAQIEAARAGGATILAGGKRADRPGFFVEPTIITDISPANPVYRQELFGPIASIYVVDSVDEAIHLANDTPYGLGGSVFGADVANARDVADRIESGMVFVNQPAWTAAELPFGGIKGSGFGRELSELGFGEFVNRKLINVAPAGSPPWGPVELDAAE